MPAVCTGKPAARLLGTYAHDRYVLQQGHIERLQRRDRSEPRDYACGSVVIAAVGHRVKVRAYHPARRCLVGAGQSQIKIAGGIRGAAQAQRRCASGNQVIRVLLALTVRRARDALGAGGMRSKVVEQFPRHRHSRAHRIGQPALQCRRHRPVLGMPGIIDREYLERKARRHIMLAIQVIGKSRAHVCRDPASLKGCNEFFHARNR